jgi:hypothetical protein
MVLYKLTTMVVLFIMLFTMTNKILYLSIFNVRKSRKGEQREGGMDEKTNILQTLISAFHKN